MSVTPPCKTCAGDTDAEDHPCAKTQRPLRRCRADLWNARPRFDGEHEQHHFYYGEYDQYMGTCRGSGDGSHCNHSMTHDVCHWCGLEWLGDGEIRCPDCDGSPAGAVAADAVPAGNTTEAGK